MKSCRLPHLAFILCQGKWSLRHCVLYKATDLQSRYSGNRVEPVNEASVYLAQSTGELNSAGFQTAVFPLLVEGIFKGMD